MNITTKHTLAPGVYIMITGILMLILGSPLSSTATEKVRLQLKWQHQFQFAGYYAAKAQGYYKAAGIDVEIIPSQPGEDPEQQVLRGKAEFGIGSTDLLLLRERGAPVVVLAVIFQHSPLALMTLKHNGLQSIHDIAGHKIMIEPGSSELYAYLNKEGISSDKFTLLPHGFHVKDLLSGNVYAMSTYVTDEPYALSKAGQNYQLYSPRSVGIDFYGDNLFTTESLLKMKPELVKAFREASLKGWAYAMNHPEELVQLIHSRYTQRHSIQHLRFEARQMIPLLQPVLVEIGHMNPGRWQGIAETYAELNMMKTNFNLSGFLYDSHPQPPDLKWLYTLMGLATIVIVVISLLTIYIYRINTRLRQEATDRKLTEKVLAKAKADVEALNDQLETALLAAHKHVREVEIAKGQIEEDAAIMDYQARHDALTGLPNRWLFSDELDRLILDLDKNARQCAVLFLDLDKFKMVNDTMGHKAGDVLLVETAVRLSSCLRENDILARMGGDEFTVLLKDIKSVNDAAVVAQRMLEKVSIPYELGGTKLVLGVSIGGSIYPDNATDAVGLLKAADAAMYKAKELGRNNYQFFSDEISEANQARVEMESDLRLALERDELRVYYQPIVDVKAMRIVGAEALIRWEHPEKGMMSPGLFIPVAEETGLVVNIGKMVLETACKQCKNWQNEGYTDFEMSVNVSPVQLSEIDFIGVVNEALSEVGLHPNCLKLEVTETILAKNDNDEVDILSILRSLGLVICLDDFGIGYSSLSRLNSLPIGHMKIDGYFIRNIAHNRKDRAMTESIIVMAHNLGIKVTAEWIEDEEQMATIRSLDCDYAQGYLISPAISAENFSKLLHTWKTRQQQIHVA